MAEKRLNDCEALVRQGIKPAGLQTADEPWKSALGSADLAVERTQPGMGRCETGAQPGRAVASAK